jgi:hypothetical protein
VKTYYKIIILLISALLLTKCSVTPKNQRSLKYSVQAGINNGGITENTDLSVVPNVNTNVDNQVDAYSGATRTGMNIGLHLNKPLKYGEIESGLDYMFNSQTFFYADNENLYNGNRKLSVSQFIVPFTYNFILFKKLFPSSDIQLKLGYLAQINIVSIEETGILPNYTTNHFSNGAVFGISAYPIKFKNGYKLGFYADAYRGSQFYEDFYNQKSFEEPGSSFIKVGLRFQFK